MRIGNGCGHQYISIITGIAEHQALITGALFLVTGLIDTHCDITRLLAEPGKHCTGFAIEATFGVVVTNIADGFAYQRFHIDFSVSGDFTGEQDHAGFHQGFAGHAGPMILFQQGIEYGIRYLVSHLVGMSAGYRFGSENV